jgi:hypothetical protein
MCNSIRPFALHVAVTLQVAVGCVLLAIGCGGPDLRDMDAVQKASLITTLRTESIDQLALFEQSDGADLDALKKHVELERETTQVAPATCPICYVRYAKALSRLGRYYDELVGAFRKELSRAAPAEHLVLEGKIARYRKEKLRLFKLSNKQFEAYFRSGEAIDPRAYQWVFRQYQAMGDYGYALFYLEQFVANTTLTHDGTRQARRLKLAFEEQVRRQEEEELMRELESEIGDGGIGDGGIGDGGIGDGGIGDGGIGDGGRGGDGARVNARARAGVGN